MTFSFVYVAHVPQTQADRGLWVGHTRVVIDQMNLLEGHIYRAAYANSIKSQALFTETCKQIYDDLDTLKKLTKDNPFQQKNISKLYSLVPQAFINPEVILQQINLMRHEEQKLLIHRQQIWGAALLHTQRIIIISQLLLFAAILLSYQFLYKERIKRRQTIAFNRMEEDRLKDIVSLQNMVSTSSLEVNEVMKRVVDSARKLVKADGTVIERIDGDEMVYDYASGSGTSFLGLRISIANSFSGKAARENIILKCDDSHIDPNVDKEACLRVGVRSMIVVPLHRKGTVFGVLKVFSSQRAAFKYQSKY